MSAKRRRGKAKAQPAAREQKARGSMTWHEGDTLCAVTLLLAEDADDGLRFQWYVKEPDHPGTGPTMTGPSATREAARESARLWASAVNCPDPDAALQAAYDAYLYCGGVLAVMTGKSTAQDLIFGLLDAFTSGVYQGSPGSIRIVRSQEELDALASEAKREAALLRSAEARWRQQAEFKRQDVCDGNN